MNGQTGQAQPQDPEKKGAYGRSILSHTPLPWTRPGHLWFPWSGATAAKGNGQKKSRCISSGDHSGGSCQQPTQHHQVIFIYLFIWQAGGDKCAALIKESAKCCSCFVLHVIKNNLSSFTFYEPETDGRYLSVQELWVEGMKYKVTAHNHQIQLNRVDATAQGLKVDNTQFTQTLKVLVSLKWSSIHWNQMCPLTVNSLFLESMTSSPSPDSLSFTGRSWW